MAGSGSPNWRQQVANAVATGAPSLATLGFASNRLRPIGDSCPFSKVGLCVAPKDQPIQRGISCSGSVGPKARCMSVVHVLCALDSVSEIAKDEHKTSLFCPQHLVSEQQRIHAGKRIAAIRVCSFRR